LGIDDQNTQGFTDKRSEDIMFDFAVFAFMQINTAAEIHPKDGLEIIAYAEVVVDPYYFLFNVIADDMKDVVIWAAIIVAGCEEEATVKIEDEGCNVGDTIIIAKLFE